MLDAAILNAIGRQLRNLYPVKSKDGNQDRERQPLLPAQQQARREKTS